MPWRWPSTPVTSPVTPSSTRTGAIHLGRVRGIHQQRWYPPKSGADRGVLGQRRRRVILRDPEERDVLPPVLSDPSACPVRRRRIHRGLLQPATAALDPRGSAKSLVKPLSCADAPVETWLSLAECRRIAGSGTARPR